MAGRIQALHLERRAYVYVRQSTATQVFRNTESTARQYGLVERARTLGWSSDTIDVIDEDLGRSGATANERSGFCRLAEAVAHGKAGAIFTLEVSRLARSSQDWQRLLALCAVAQVPEGKPPIRPGATWEAYLSNLDKMRRNAARRSSTGAPREGRALLTGVLLCGVCGRRMRTTYAGGIDHRWTYVCYGEQDRGQRVCWTVSGRAIDSAVEDLLLRMIIPDEFDLTLAVEREVEAQAASLHEQWKLRLEQAEYEARRAERRYMAVDPDNRVVARTLEGQWEERLQDLEQVRQRFEDARRERHVQLSDADRTRIRALARDLPAVWHASTTTPADRKAMLRLVIEAVAIRPIDLPQRLTQIDVQWKSGAVDHLTVARPRGADHNRTPAEAIERIRELATLGLSDQAIAQQLSAERMRSGSGGAWTPCAVKHLRHKHGVVLTVHGHRGRDPLPDRHPDGRYSMRAPSSCH